MEVLLNLHKHVVHYIHYSFSWIDVLQICIYLQYNTDRHCTFDTFLTGSQSFLRQQTNVRSQYLDKISQRCCCKIVTDYRGEINQNTNVALSWTRLHTYSSPIVQCGSLPSCHLTITTHGHGGLKIFLDNKNIQCMDIGYLELDNSEIEEQE